MLDCVCQRNSCGAKPTNFCPVGSGHVLQTNAGYYATQPHLLDGGGYGGQRFEEHRNKLSILIILLQKIFVYIIHSGTVIRSLLLLTRIGT